MRSDRFSLIAFDFSFIYFTPLSFDCNCLHPILALLDLFFLCVVEPLDLILGFLLVFVGMPRYYTAFGRVLRRLKVLVWHGSCFLAS